MHVTAVVSPLTYLYDVLQVELGMTSSGKENTAASSEWRELRAQVQFLDDECRTLRRKVNNLQLVHFFVK